MKKTVHINIILRSYYSIHFHVTRLLFWTVLAKHTNFYELFSPKLSTTSKWIMCNGNCKIKFLNSWGRRVSRVDKKGFVAGTLKTTPRALSFPFYWQLCRIIIIIVDVVCLDRLRFVLANAFPARKRILGSEIRQRRQSDDKFRALFFFTIIDYHYSWRFLSPSIFQQRYSYKRKTKQTSLRRQRRVISLYAKPCIFSVVPTGHIRYQ